MRRGVMPKVVLALLIVIGVSVPTARGAELIPLRATYASLWIAQDKVVFNKYG